MDPDAAAYITAVEAADEIASPGIGALEEKTKIAIDNFVLGCKADGIWDAIKASCILAGAKTRIGALTPLAGASGPDSFFFVDGDYNRKTGLLGDAFSKYLDTKRPGNEDPETDFHGAVFSTSPGLTSKVFMGSQTAGTPVSISNIQLSWQPSNQLLFRTRCANINDIRSGATGTGFIGVSRSSNTVHNPRFNGVTYTTSMNSTAPGAENYFVFANNGLGTPSLYSSARLAFYSIGESLDLAKLDARVTDLINAIGVAIP
jgi:hypothetical protein